MATGNDILRLIKAHVEGDEEQFRTAVLAAIADAKGRGHTHLARDMQVALNKPRRRQNIKMIQPIQQGPRADGLVVEELCSERLDDLVMSAEHAGRLKRIVQEQETRDLLKAHGLAPRRKILFYGPPGTGKTLTARALAAELHLPLRVVQTDRIIGRFLGESTAALRKVFEAIAAEEAVYFFDEFDSIGADRGRQDDVGEMRRVLNVLLQFVEADHSDSVVVAATNYHSLLDRALFRRFDDVLEYHLPDEATLFEVARRTLGDFAPGAAHLATDLFRHGLSHADVVEACRGAMKEAVLAGNACVRVNDLERMLQWRRGPE